MRVFCDKLKSECSSVNFNLRNILLKKILRPRSVTMLCGKETAAILFAWVDDEEIKLPALISDF